MQDAAAAWDWGGGAGGGYSGTARGDDGREAPADLAPLPDLHDPPGNSERKHLHLHRHLKGDDPMDEHLKEALEGATRHTTQ